MVQFKPLGYFLLNLGCFNGGEKLVPDSYRVGSG